MSKNTWEEVWETAQDWAHFIAMDKTGHWYYHEVRPYPYEVSTTIDISPDTLS